MTERHRQTCNQRSRQNSSGYTF